MLKDSLYNISSLDNHDNVVNATLAIDQNHKIFKGHFPGQSVLPGACMLQIVKEVLETAIDKQLRLIKGDDLKFLAIIDPNINTVLQLLLNYTLLDDGTIRVSANLLAESIVCFKFKGVFRLMAF